MYGNKISVSEIILLFVYAIGVTFIEGILSFGWDNLIIPITAGLALILIIS